MPDRYCDRCHQLVPADEWRRHYDRHESLERERHSTAAHTNQRRRALERAHHRCEQCGRTALEAGYPLELHHLDGDWRNHDDDSRVRVLCHDCHTITYRIGPHPDSGAGDIYARLRNLRQIRHHLLGDD
jgi:hypothetical protein